MIKNRTLMVCVVIFTCMVMTGIAFAQQVNSGAIVKMPYPLSSHNLTLESQKVKITVYSTFIQVDAEYAVKNETPEEISATFGFPVNLHSTDVSLGESEPFNLVVPYGKEQDYYVREKIEGTVDEKNGSFYKKWYGWDMDIPAKRTTRFKMQYYMKLNRENGIPHLTYELSKAKEYAGTPKESLIVVDMPMDVERIPFSTEKFPSSDSFIYSSLPKPDIDTNVMTWNLSGHSFDRDLELYFYANGYPDWEVKVSEENFSGEKGTNLLDGNFKTHWRVSGEREGIGSWVEFKPVIRSKDGRSRSFAPKVFQLGVVPGNCATVSDFYSYTHLREAEAEILKVSESSDPTKPNVKVNPFGASEGPKLQDPKKTSSKQPRRIEKKDVIYLYCEADPTMQVFKSGLPLDTTQGPIQVRTVSVYSGQNNKDLCISEFLIFDRSPNELIQW